MNQRFVCIGHRGAAGYEPENTLRSVRKALELGADGIEIDVQLVDGQLVVFHDTRLERTTNGTGLLAKQSFEVLRSLDAGYGEVIPCLREVCELIRGRALLNIELKGKGTAAPVVDSLRELIAGGGYSFGNFLLSSFRLRELKVARKLGGNELRLGLLLARPTHFWRRTGRLLGITSVHPNARWVTARMVKHAHTEGWQVLPYTVNNPVQIGRMRELGVDGVITDFPDRILKTE